MTQNIDKLNILFEELVPAVGKAENLAGELVRAAERIGYRFFNDGDQIGIGYGKETCNAAARFLMANTPKEVSELVAGLWGLYSEKGYEALLDVMIGELVAYIEAHAETRQQPTKDMFDYYDKYEDVDDSYDDEDDEDDWDDEEDDEDDDY